MAAVMRFAADDVTSAIVPASGHWVMEENPAATIELVVGFLAKPSVAPRKSGSPLPSSTSDKAASAGPGTSGVGAIQTIVLKGDPTKAGLYTILLRVPAHTRIAAHRHPDERIATVVSGTWYFGYGKSFDPVSLKALPAGSFYTEPPAEDHFAETRETAVMVQITGIGPTGTTYVEQANNPAK